MNYMIKLKRVNSLFFFSILLIIKKRKSLHISKLTIFSLKLFYVDDEFSFISFKQDFIILQYVFKFLTKFFTLLDHLGSLFNLKYLVFPISLNLSVTHQN